MSVSDGRGRRSTILPAPACDLLDRLTAELGIKFTLTDLHGMVLASTAGDLAGQQDRVIANAAYHGSSPSEPGRVFVSLRLSGQPAGMLVAYGSTEEVESATTISAIAIGLALDFAEAASELGHDRLNPGWLLYRLLKGSVADAQQARVMAVILGWELTAQRVAIAVEVRYPNSNGGARGSVLETIDRVIRGRGNTPMGQISECEWVAFVRHEPGANWSHVRGIAETLHRELSLGGTEVAIGIGEPHLPVQPLASLRRSYREAAYALRIGSQTTAAGGVFEFRGLGPIAFFAPSSPSRRKLAALVLEPLQRNEGLLATLHAFLSTNMSVAATAAELGLHAGGCSSAQAGAPGRAVRGGDVRAIMTQLDKAADRRAE